MPEKDLVVSILNEILISTKYKYNGNSENMKVNHMVAWYSRSQMFRFSIQCVLKESEHNFSYQVQSIPLSAH